MTDNTAGQAERGLWTDERIEAELRRIGDNMRLYIADAATVAQTVRDDYEQALAAAQARIAQLEVQFETARAGQRHGQARIAEIEAQLAERGEYVPVDVAFIRCDDGHYLQVEQQTVAVGPYGKHSVTAFDLPEPYYICRRVQREDDSHD